MPTAVARAPAPELVDEAGPVVVAPAAEPPVPVAVPVVPDPPEVDRAAVDWTKRSAYNH